MDQLGQQRRDLRADVAWGVRGVVRLLPAILLVAVFLFPLRAAQHGWTLDDIPSLLWAVPAGIVGWILIGAYVGLLRPLTRRGRPGAAAIGASLYGIIAFGVCLAVVLSGNQWPPLGWVFMIVLCAGVGAIFGIAARWALS